MHKIIMNIIFYLLLALYFILIVGLLAVSNAEAGALDALKESWRPKVEYTKADRVFQGFMVGSQIADYTSTKDALSRGCIEKSRLYGERPSDGALIAGKVVSALLITWAGNNIRDHTFRKWWYGTMGLIAGGVAMHNYNIHCY